MKEEFGATLRMRAAETEQDSGPDAEEVLAYLARHPDFFLRHETILAELELPHRAGAAVSLVERQVEMNSAQVRFDNELVQYADERFDRMSRHYDRVLGLHGRRMEEIDERHLILQQELIRHVHDLVARIELVFEAAEQNHLYLEGTLRETREELSKLSARLEALERESK